MKYANPSLVHCDPGSDVSFKPTCATGLLYGWPSGNGGMVREIGRET